MIVPLSHRDAYLDRYAEPDKGWTDRDEASWPVPYWHIDTGMAALLILQTAVDEGLGACFFGIPPEQIDAFREAFGVPAAYTPIGAVTVGHRVSDPAPAGRPPGARAGTSTTWSTTAGGASGADTPSVHRAHGSGSTATRRPRSRIRDTLASCHG